MTSVWLNVAEKPSVAKELVSILGSGTRVSYQRTASVYNSIAEFDMTLENGSHVKMIVTSVTGHLMETDFDEATCAASWPSIPIDELFVRPIQKRVKPENDPIRQNIDALARRSTHFIGWLDCDREGENIYYEVYDVARASNPRIVPKRARFSTLTKRDVWYAINNVMDPNPQLSAAVDARAELDLRIGAAFTRYQTMTLRGHFSGVPRMISYGPCQFPTLGFVIDRFWERESFRAESFWKIVVTHKNSVFLWKRGVLYDHTAATVLYARALMHQPIQATVMEVEEKPSRKVRPVPLTTVEMQKLASRHLRMTSERCMAVAESLYQDGFLSYPRTETDTFHFADGDLMELIQLQTTHPQWGPYAQQLHDSTTGKYERPREGQHDDHAHPPIHPTKALPGDCRDPDKVSLYGLVARYFLSCCSRDAVGSETVVAVKVGEELFTTKGNCIHMMNWLEVFPFEKWFNKEIPVYKKGEVFTPDKIVLEEGKTQSPSLLAEVDLISLMDKNGIGTDATIATHIKTIQDREYAVVTNGSFAPTKLGLALTQAYETLDMRPLLQPFIRANLESDLTAIAMGTKSKDIVVRNALLQYREIFGMVSANTKKILEIVGQWFPPRGAVGMRDVAEGGICGSCNGQMVIREGAVEGEQVDRVVWCEQCRVALRLPHLGGLVLSPFTCMLCNFPVFEVTNSETGRSHHLCAKCFSNPPEGSGFTEMRCFSCSVSECPLASGQQAMRRCEFCGQGEVVMRKGKPPSTGRYLKCKVCPYHVSLPNEWTLKVLEGNACARCNSLLVAIPSFGGPPVVGLEPGCIVCLWCCRELYPFMSYRPVTHHQVIPAVPQPIAAQPSNRTRAPKATRASRASPDNRGGGGRGGRGGTHTTRTSSHNNHHNGDASHIPLKICGCGLPTVEYTSTKETSRGRKFHCCSKPRDDPSKCNFFEWTTA
eukprot:PhF_6_TR11744/c0_g1_i2/m.19207/K03165/TOP3; DNA topoisomerase III